METLNLVQGTPEWHAHRATHFNASDAPAMLGVSAYKTRTQLLHEMATGQVPEVDAATQKRFDYGHKFEALARPLAEEFIGEELFPVVGAEGKLSASFDGLTMDESIGFEHKTLNAELRGIMSGGCTGAQLPPAYRAQMEQQLMISGGQKILFMASSWRGEELIDELHCWYESDTVMRDALLQGWAQFEVDLKAYAPAQVEAKPEGRTPESLPALHIEVTGMVTASNLAEFRAHALEVFASINTELTTDQQFADAEKTVKWCSDVEERLAAAKQHALSQTQSIDALFRTIDDISAEARRVRLDLSKRVDAEKVNRRNEIQQKGVQALVAHVATLNERLGRPYMPASAAVADFAGAMKGKKSITSLREAVATTLANAKISASAIADGIQINMNTLRELASEHVFLFPDVAQLVLKANDDLTALVKNRIAEHQAKEQARIDAEREQIRKEETERAGRIQREAQETEDKLIASIWDNARRIEFDSVPYIRKAIAAFESGPGKFAGDQRPRVASAVASAREEMKGKLDAATEREQAAAAAPAPVASPAPVAPVPTPAPAPTVIAMPVRVAASAGAHPSLTLGQIKDRIAPLQITADGLATLGFTGLKERGAVLFHESDFPYMCAAIVDHVQRIQAKQAA